MPSLGNFTDDDEDDEPYLSHNWGDLIFLAIPFTCMIILIVKQIQYKLSNCQNQNQEQNQNHNQNENLVRTNSQVINNYIENLSNNNKKLVKNQDCSICIEPLKKNYVILECGHIYHIECIKPWIETNMNSNKNALCPNCREEIVINC